MTHRRAFKRFATDPRGSTAIIFAISIIPLTAAIGCAVDGVRWFEAKRRTEQAVDAALLTGARMMQLDSSDETSALQGARRAYAANVTARSPVSSDNVDFELTDGKKSISVKGDATMTTAFLSVIGVNTLSLVPVGKAKAAFTNTGGNRGSNIEVSVMLDVTGSMCDDGSGPCTTGTKINGLREATEDLINIVVPDTAGTFSSKIAIVPFSTRIRVDPDSGNGSLMKALTNLNPTLSGWTTECTTWSWVPGATTEAPGTWSCNAPYSVQFTNWRIFPCVTERVMTPNWDGTGVDYSDDAPGTGKWLNAHGGDRSPVAWDSTESSPTAAGYGASSANPMSQWNYGSSSWCEDVPDANVVSPLSADKATLIGRVQNLEAGGATAGAAGIAWTWYTLSPKWSSIWTGTSAPGSYADLTNKQANGAPLLRKVAVLMSDGVFNALRGEKGKSATVVSNHAKQLCTNMKSAGIEIYSVAFALDELPAADRAIAEDVMKSCGSDISHFYSSLTVPELKASFRDIALKVAPVRLTQ